MEANRVFLPQQAMDEWMAEERITLEDDVLTLKPSERRFKLVSALRFTQEVGGGGDANRLAGKVIPLERVAELGGEHCANSVLVGDDAYDVIEGFLGEPLEPDHAVATGSDMVSATRAATGDIDPEKDVDPLTEWLLNER